MKIEILTLFPDMFKGPFDESIIKRAQERRLVEIQIHDLRRWGLGTHRSVDDRPYSGGVGMVLMPEPIDNALKEIRKQNSWVLATTATGRRFTQKAALELSQKEHIIILAGHYEGFDQRILDNLVDEEISIGDYVLTGGELPAMVITDTVARLLPGVLEKSEATAFESFSKEYPLEYPQYTRPEDYKGWKVPTILLSGDHKKIEEWKKQESLKRTKKHRPDLLE